MADIYFTCQRCRQNLVIDAAGAGLAVKCPACGELLSVPVPEEDLKHTQKVMPFEYQKPVNHTKAA